MLALGGFSDTSELDLSLDSLVEHLDSVDDFESYSDLYAPSAELDVVALGGGHTPLSLRDPRKRRRSGSPAAPGSSPTTAWLSQSPLQGLTDADLMHVAGGLLPSLPTLPPPAIPPAAAASTGPRASARRAPALGATAKGVEPQASGSQQQQQQQLLAAGQRWQRDAHTTSNSENNKRPRGHYKCGRCGRPKNGHTCTMTPDLRSIGTQAELHVTKAGGTPQGPCRAIWVSSAAAQRYR